MRAGNPEVKDRIGWGLDKVHPRAFQITTKPSTPTQHPTLHKQQTPQKSIDRIEPELILQINSL